MFAVVLLESHLIGHSEGKIVVLVSYAHTEESSWMSTDSAGTRRVFALIRLSVYGDIFKVEGIKTVPYQTVSSCGFFASLC